MFTQILLSLFLSGTPQSEALVSTLTKTFSGNEKVSMVVDSQTEAVVVMVGPSQFAIPYEPGGFLNPRNEQLYKLVEHVMAGQLKIQSVDTFIGQSVFTRSGNVPVIAAIAVTTTQ